jgi:SpoVK/Ycf46/Vps4 family AAA+-type ATPase
VSSFYILPIDRDLTLSQLKLDDGTLNELSRIRDHLATRSQLRSEDREEPPAHGVIILFSGVSGTGKTMAAAALANELNLNLYQIDLAAAVSKYIGETEKNLRRVFDEADAGGAILLFDEADALFGKRTEVKDSHDRYANLDIGSLLQRIEQHHGITILATSKEQDIDEASLRRIRHTVHFAPPDNSRRSEMWQSELPPTTKDGGS